MKHRYKQIIRIQRCMMDSVEHIVTVRRINGWYHCRIFVDGVLNQEAKCEYKLDIGYTCRSMLRMEDKSGNISAFAHAARHRNYG